MTLKIECERKRLHVVIHHLPVRQSGSDCTSTGSRSVQECQSPEKYDINIDNVPLTIPTPNVDAKLSWFQFAEGIAGLIIIIYPTSLPTRLR
jgi:hypothetical protein